MDDTTTTEIPVVILAGGRGARFDHESQVRPKPMIEVADKPILEHIVDSLAKQGFRRFIVATGYLGDQISDHFLMHDDYAQASLGPDGHVFTHKNSAQTVVVIDTGENSHTGERLMRLSHLLRRRFVLTYGDGLSDVDMRRVLERHQKTSTTIWWGEERPDEPVPALVTLTAVRPAGRFGAIGFHKIDDWGVGAVQNFREKPSEAWINGGFMVIEPEFIDRYLSPVPRPTLESEALAQCADDGFMRAYPHAGYWRCMDTRRDLEQIEEDVRRAGGRLPWLR